ncbi:OLC1v1026577C1 [Oldenlandia corymbosa var. corymbosa]|uniref:OLC1v1026577C1 n=1 Tax=Oldenlandia corymbosa var. corymbosa TaxID=529605 RepID=A0AAV1C846_OLDCO|nr:OLC1v1026577C1 [Oldenlandia corymbosa var. corymbosa]
MDREEKSSRRDRDSDRDHHKHHSSSKHKSGDADDDRRHSHSHHRSKYREDGEDRHSLDRRSSREYSAEREKSVELRSEAEGGRHRDRSRERHKRGKSKDREKSYDREDSTERKHIKRKERGGESGEDSDGGAKRARVLEDRKERRKKFDEDVNGGKAEEKKERRKFEDVDGGKENREEQRERRRFEDKGKKGEHGTEFDDLGKITGFDERSSQQEQKPELPVAGNVNTGGSISNGNGVESCSTASWSDTHLHEIHSPDIKVSSISTTNENKGVNINRSHEVPGKSSTDGTGSDAAKVGVLSRDNLDKAKKALQKMKELQEKTKKIPVLNKASGVNRESSPHLGPAPGVNNTPSTGSGIPATPSSLASSSPVTTSRMSTLPAVGDPMNPPPLGLPHLSGLNPERFEAVKKAQELAAKMGFRQDPEFAPLINMFPGQLLPDVAIQPKPAKAPVLRLDALGREIDEHGNVVNVPKVNTLSTLKVNINKQKKDAFQILKPELEVDPSENPHFDPRMGINKNKILRPKRMSFQFVEEGKWSKDAETLRLKSQFGEARAKELKAKQAQLAKAKAEPDINPNLIEVSERVVVKEKPKEVIPEVEWWDIPLLLSGNYNDIIDGDLTDDKLKMDKITIYVEHPRPIEPPVEPTLPPPQPLKLTKKEQKKLRTQRRLLREKDKQDMIRQGLLEPPKPKVKMSNLHKVLGTEATQDPTKLEREIRNAALEREQAHIDRNIARKLTPAERREKKERKLFDDPNNAETIVSVYKVRSLAHPQARFKVDANAHENRLTGCAVISEGICVVVVEGCPKSIKRYGKLMLRRINWAAVEKNEEEDEDEDMDDDAPVNKCMLVWQGSVAKSSFHKFSIHECRTEAAARKIFSDAGVGHYWDLALNFSEE